jgi:hypothetical protein
MWMQFKPVAIIQKHDCSFKIHQHAKRYSLPSILRIIKSRLEEMDRALHEWGRKGIHVGYWWENRKERV